MTRPEDEENGFSAQDHVEPQPLPSFDGRTLLAGCVLCDLVDQGRGWFGPAHIRDLWASPNKRRWLAEAHNLTLANPEALHWDWRFVPAPLEATWVAAPYPWETDWCEWVEEDEPEEPTPEEERDMNGHERLGVSVDPDRGPEGLRDRGRDDEERARASELDGPDREVLRRALDLDEIFLTDDRWPWDDFDLEVEEAE